MWNSLATEITKLISLSLLKKLTNHYNSLHIYKFHTITVIATVILVTQILCEQVCA